MTVIRCYIVILLLFIGGSSVLSAQAQPSSESARFDNGKMWTFDFPPTEYFEETYGFDIEESWFERARLGALRIPGCTASFVSSYGLVLTNHHCSRNAITGVTRSGEKLFEEGFYAEELSEERSVPGMYADMLIAIDDVTDKVNSAQDLAETEAEKVQAREDVIASIKDSLSSAFELPQGSIEVEVVPLYHGGLYSAYTFRRFDDIRLVIAPEAQIGYYGGDEDNFTFPRYTLDITFFRIYEENVPYEPEHFFLWSLEGVKSGEPVFVIGNPGSTSRLETVAQLEYRRDVSDKNLLAFIKSRIEALEAAKEAISQQEEKVTLENLLFSLRNADKAYTGQLSTIEDPVIMARRQDAEKQFVRAIMSDEQLQSTFGGEIEHMEEIQSQLRELRSAHGSFLALSSSAYSSALMRRALLFYQYQQRLESSAPSEEMEELKERIGAIGDQIDPIGYHLLAARLADFNTYLGEDEAMVAQILDGKNPEKRAQEIWDNSRLSTQESTQQALASDEALDADPAVELVSAFIESYQEFQSAFAGLSAQQSETARKIGQARYQVYGTTIPPDATFSLRIADGVVRGYPYNGTYASPFTSFFGLYDHYYSYGSNSAWALPERWLQPMDSFDLSVPLNFVSTNDIIGGNSGSPVLNKDLELVGLIFDGNIESLAGNYIYLPELNRAVSVDARGILEALDEVYSADRLVIELTDDELVPSEEEADQQNRAVGERRSSNP